LASSYGADETMKFFIEEIGIFPYCENYRFEELPKKEGKEGHFHLNNL
jgi:hypothetical protein